MAAQRLELVARSAKEIAAAAAEKEALVAMEAMEAHRAVQVEKVGSCMVPVPDILPRCVELLLLVSLRQGCCLPLAPQQVAESQHHEQVQKAMRQSAHSAHRVLRMWRMRACAPRQERRKVAASHLRARSEGSPRGGRPRAWGRRAQQHDEPVASVRNAKSGWLYFANFLQTIFGTHHAHDRTQEPQDRTNRNAAALSHRSRGPSKCRLHIQVTREKPAGDHSAPAGKESHARTHVPQVPSSMARVGKV